jgi:hypothetical protein
MAANRQNLKGMSGAHHEEEVHQAADDVEARVLQAEQVQVLAAKLCRAPGAGVRRRAAILAGNHAAGAARLAAAAVCSDNMGPIRY